MMKALVAMVTLAIIISGLALQAFAGPAASDEVDQREEDQVFTILLPHQDFGIFLPPQDQE